MDDKAQEDQAAIDRARHEVAVLASLIKKQLLALFKQPFDESLLPPVHLPSCPAFAASTGPRVSCKCAREYHERYAERDRVLANQCHFYLRHQRIRPFVLDEWKRLPGDTRTTNGRRDHAAASRVLQRIVAQFHPDLGITETIAHHTTSASRLDAPAFDREAKELLGASSIALIDGRSAVVMSDANGASVAVVPRCSVSISAAEYLREMWSYACDIRLGRDGLIYEPRGTGRVARKARLIRCVLVALGKCHEPSSDGVPRWQQVPLRAIAEDIGCPTTGARYTALGKLLEHLQMARIVWGTKKTRSRAFRLLCFRHLPDQR